jgi:hypothetical protein
MLAEQGLFPSFFGPESRLGARAGLFITAALALVVANLIDLSAIASVGSAVALVIDLLVGAAGYRRRADTGSNAVIVRYRHSDWPSIISQWSASHRSISPRSATARRRAERSLRCRSPPVAAEPRAVSVERERAPYA